MGKVDKDTTCGDLPKKHVHMHLQSQFLVLARTKAKITQNNKKHRDGGHPFLAGGKIFPSATSRALRARSLGLEKTGALRAPVFSRGLASTTTARFARCGIHPG